MDLRFGIPVIILFINLGLQRPQDLPVIPPFEDPGDIFVKDFVIPQYPPIARQVQVQGDVTAIMHIRADGSLGYVSDVEGPPLLQDATYKALKQWSFFRSKDGGHLKITFKWRVEAPGSDYPLFKVSGHFPSEVDIVTNQPAPLGPDVIETPKKKH
jgi:hypothetical protein